MAASFFVNPHSSRIVGLLAQRNRSFLQQKRMFSAQDTAYCTHCSGSRDARKFLAESDFAGSKEFSGRRRRKRVAGSPTMTRRSPERSRNDADHHAKN